MRVLIRTTWWLLLLSAGGLTLSLSQISYAQLLEYFQQPNVASAGGVFQGFPASAARWLLLRSALAGLTLVSALALGLDARARRAAVRIGRGTARPASTAASEVSSRRAAGLPGSWQDAWRALSQVERVTALLLLLLITVWRGYYAWTYPLSLDEIASFDYAVLPGAAVTASYYPLPNNHLLPNLLVAGLRVLLPAGSSPVLLLRLLPTLLSTALLPLSYGLLLRHARFGVATLGLGLFSLSPLAVYYAVAGRGYAWALAATVLGLAAALALLTPETRRRGRDRAWAVFVSSAVVGLFAVPTHAYAVLALVVSLAIGFSHCPLRVRRQQLGRLALALAGVGGVVVVLYAPVGLLSGWNALLHNPYVARHPLAEMRTELGPFLMGTAAELLGQRGWSAAAYLLLLMLAPLALRRRAGLSASARRLGWLLYAQLGWWLLLVFAQGVYPPARTLLVVLLAFFLLVALFAEVVFTWLKQVFEKSSLISRLPVRIFPTLQVAALSLILLAYGGYRWHREQPVLAILRAQQVSLHQTYAWLRTQPFTRIWVEPRAFAIFWHHYALTAGQSPLPLLVVDDGVAQGQRPGMVPGSETEILAAPPDSARPGQPVVALPGGAWAMPVSAGQPLLVLP